MTSHPWRHPDDPAEEAARREAYERLARAARRAGLSLDRLNQMLRQLSRNEDETRRFLAREVYGVPDDLLDDLVRVRLADLTNDPGPPDQTPVQ
jgi:hypothetical protein